MQRKVTITLYHEYGHPDNVVNKARILEAFADELPKVLDKIKHPSVAFNWQIDSIRVE